MVSAWVGKEAYSKRFILDALVFAKLYYTTLDAAPVQATGNHGAKKGLFWKYRDKLFKYLNSDKIDTALSELSLTASDYFYKMF